MDEQNRAELVACLEAGATARMAEIAHSANPHLRSRLLLGAMQGSTEAALQMMRLGAWWDGWEEVDHALRRSLNRAYRTPP